jgi:hypothetical protein
MVCRHHSIVDFELHPRLRFKTQGKLVKSRSKRLVFGGFCLFCAVLTLLCGCCDQDEEKKKQHYRGSALCFVIGVGVIVATVFLMSEEGGTD